MTAPIEGLRQATRDVHERLHLHPAFVPLTGNPPDPRGYSLLLRQLHGFHAPAEAVMFEAAERLIPELDDLPQRRKAHLLEDDIAALSATFPSAGPLAELLDLRIGLSRPEVLGCLYVTEGATLGGRELGRKLAPVLEPLGLAEPDGRRFLLAYGAGQGAMWRRFVGVLGTACSSFSSGEQAAMEQSAREMFLTFERWLTGCVALA